MESRQEQFVRLLPQMLILVIVAILFAAGLFLAIPYLNGTQLTPTPPSGVIIVLTPTPTLPLIAPPTPQVDSILVTVEAIEADLEILSAKVEALAALPTSNAPQLQNDEIAAMSPRLEIAMNEIQIQGTRIANIENLIQTDPQQAVSMILLQRDLAEVSDNLQEVQGGVNQLRQDTRGDLGILWGFVVATVFALLLIVVSSYIQRRETDHNTPRRG